MVHPADTPRRSGKDDVPGQQRHDLGEVAHQEGNGEDEIAGIGLLHGPAVHPAFDGQVGGIDLVADERAEGAEGVKALGNGPLALLGLQVSGGYVVCTGVAEDVLVYLGNRDEPCFLSDDDGELCLVVKALAHRRVLDDSALLQRSGGGFDEYHRFGGYGKLELLGMVLVVEADADGLGVVARSQYFYFRQCELSIGNVVRIERCSFEYLDGIALEQSVADCILVFEA